MKWILRGLIGVGILLVVLVGAGAFTIYQWTRGPLPQHNGELTLAELNDTVEVLRDRWGVPHIYASTMHDLRFAQGFVQAQDRWWQMEFFRRTGRGEIQQLTGRNAALMGTDIFIRTAGWRRAAERDWEAMPDDIRAQLQAFADGVNAYITERPAGQLAMEYNILGITGVDIPIEPWTPIDSIVWTKAMAWDLSGSGRGEELERSRLLENFDQAMVDAFAVEFPFGEKPTIIMPEDLPEAGEPFAPVPDRETAGLVGLDSHMAGNYDGAGVLFGMGDGIGSNNWVVDGSLSSTDMPLLANDPHLGIQMPSIWYEVGLHCQPVTDECPVSVRGFTFSPSPAVVIGHNGRIGWGVTNVGWDVLDLYALEINPENELQYRWNDEWRAITVHEEDIRFGNSDETITIQVRETHLGPIINDNQLDEDTGDILGFNNENPLAMRWTALDEGTLIESIIRLNEAQNWDEFRAALQLWDVPSQNFVYADVDGNIGYQTPGRVPIRAAGHDGRLPVDGTTDAYEWLGYVPYEYLPSVLNPERGYIASANQALVPFDYYDQLANALADEYGADAHYVFDYYWALGYRGERIVALLESTDEHDFETFAAIHGDNKMIVAEEIAPFLDALDFDDESLAELRDWMLAWDYQMHTDSPQAALFAVFWKKLMHNLYVDQTDEIASVNGGTRDMWATVNLLENPTSAWWDDVNTEAVETPDDILVRSFEDAVTEIRALLGDNRAAWRWGDLHTATFVSNPLGVSGINTIEIMVNSQRVPTSGGSAIVNATSWSTAADDYAVRAVPSMRMILDMSDLSNSQSVHTTGQSGHPFSPYYDDMIDDWRTIKYRPMLWAREDVEANTRSTLILQP